MSKIAVKKLTLSDLSLFTWHFKSTENKNRQTAINLNKNVFIDILYPELADNAKGPFELRLSICGPGHAGTYIPVVKVAKPNIAKPSKNWRLSGPTIDNPDEDPKRFNCLNPDDYAIMSFGGETKPTELTVTLVCASLEEDKPLHAGLDEVMADSSMVALSSDELDALLAGAAKEALEDAAHGCIDELMAGPLMLALSSDELDDLLAGAAKAALQDAAQVGNDGQRYLTGWTSSRNISKDELDKARERANDTGRRGEEFVDYFLSQELAGDRIKTYEWASVVNAIEAFDFKVDNSVLIDVKSTTYSFQQKLHISFNELLHMRDYTYHLYRIYDIQEKQAKLRICANVCDIAAQTIQILERLPFGIKVDSISLSPDCFRFDEEILIDRTQVEPPA